jgi:hypothetical protein
MSQARTDPAIDSTDTTTSLAHAIEHIDTATDDRDCPHGCHGTLSVDDDDRVICETCRCTPAGVYIPPSEDSSRTDSRCSQFQWFYPRGQTGDNGDAESFDHDKYNGPDNSTTLTRVRMAGGYQHVYDETHSAGAGDAYEWDISSF